MWEINNSLNYITGNLNGSIFRLLLPATWKQFLKNRIFKSYTKASLRIKYSQLQFLFAQFLSERSTTNISVFLLQV